MSHRAIWGDSEPKKGRKKISHKYKIQIAEGQHWKCKKCSRSINENEFDIDHKDGNPRNNDITNLRALCVKCHRTIHSGSKSKRDGSSDYVPSWRKMLGGNDTRKKSKRPSKAGRKFMRSNR